jgi:hypothetical protein
MAVTSFSKLVDALPLLMRSHSLDVLPLKYWKVATQSASSVQRPAVRRATGCAASVMHRLYVLQRLWQRLHMRAVDPGRAGGGGGGLQGPLHPPDAARTHPQPESEGCLQHHKRAPRGVRMSACMWDERLEQRWVAASVPERVVCEVMLRGCLVGTMGLGLQLQQAVRPPGFVFGADICGGLQLTGQVLPVWASLMCGPSIVTSRN